MTFSKKSEPLANGWYRCENQDRTFAKQGLYCDKCNTRIPELDIYYTDNIKWPGQKQEGTDLCERCYDMRKANDNH